jgi:hypothetical protein
MGRKLGTKRFDIDKQSVAREFKARNGTLCRIAMAETGWVLDNRWYVAEISAVPHCRFNTNFHDNTDDRKCVNTAIAQRDVKRCASEC